MGDIPAHHEWAPAVKAYQAAHPEIDWDLCVPAYRTLPDGGWEVVPAYYPARDGAVPRPDRTRVDVLLSAVGEAIRELDRERKVIAYIVRDPKTGKEAAYMPEEVTIVREAKD